MRTLVLLTTSYPFGKGEEFLHNELRCADGFDKIYICPLTPNSEQITKTIPSNAEILNLKLSSFQASSLFKYDVIAEAIRVLPDLKQLRETLFFYKKSAVKAQAILNALPDLSEHEVLLYSYWLLDTAVTAALIKSRLQCKTISAVSRAHGYDLYEYRSKSGRLPFRRYILRNLDRICPCSQNGANYLSARYPRYKDKISASYLGTSDNGIKYGVQKPFHLVSCSYLVPVKRIHLIIDALKLLKFPISWTHLGGGELESELRLCASELPDNITCDFKGHMQNTEIIEYYKTHDCSLFINTSASEGLPVSFMEAASFGLPIIATDVGGSSELVKDGENGILLSPSPETNEIADAISRVYDLPSGEYKALCENSRKLWRSNFNSKQNYTNFFAPYTRKDEND